MKLGFLHTAESHVARFSALVDHHSVQHVVRVDLLSDAAHRDVSQDVIAALTPLSDCDAILCSCSTLGPIIDALGRDRVLRIDRPAMEMAVRLGPRPLIVICTEATASASMALLTDCATAGGQDIDPQLLLCEGAWAHFLAGSLDAYIWTIDLAVRTHVSRYGLPTVIVLAQASMDGAAAGLSDLGVPVLATPTAAVAQLMHIAGR